MPRKTKSSLTAHYFPTFYACYLLKSIRTPRSTATYIGSTPSPPRRIRQHNGEITQGAWKTKHNRPWVMQMIVHGFPSKLAALQFEWAWQHPHISRHLRDEEGNAVFNRDRKFKYLKTNVMVAHSMICSHPYNTWPLHVKLFTEEAVKAWKDACAGLDKGTVPPGFTCVTELEGVDGKSGKAGSGRIAPIDTTDSQFAASHLRKMSALLASHEHLVCSVCNTVLENHPPDPLTTALCPASNCSAVSHLTCLSQLFLKETAAQSQTIPRGGECRSCRSYILWGDVIRGCFRRRGGANPVPESEADDEDEEDGYGEDLLGSDSGNNDARLLVTTQGVRAASKARPKNIVARVHSTRCGNASERESEFFDLNAISGDSQAEEMEPEVINAPQQGPKRNLNRPLATEAGPSLPRTPLDTVCQQLSSNPISPQSARVRQSAKPRGASSSSKSVAFSEKGDLARQRAKPSSQDLPMKPAIPKSRSSRVLRNSQSHDPRRIDDGTDDLELVIMDTQEEPSARGLNYVNAEFGSNQNRALAPFPGLLPLSQPRYPPIRKQRPEGPCRVWEVPSDSDSDGSSSSNTVEIFGRRDVSRDVASTSKPLDEDFENAEPVRLSRAMSTLSVSSYISEGPVIPLPNEATGSIISGRVEKQNFDIIELSD
ncbi:hypothetical protein AcW1_002622 [Taiwanofungus camphoratus]|nr:hypothetical protein AcW1_002622 [Antrodia cinnamomea]